MKLALTRRGEYPEPIRAELDQMVAAIVQSYLVEHDGEGRQRRTWARFLLGENQSLTSGSQASLLCRLPDAGNTDDLTVDPTTGRVRVVRAGTYSVIGQVRFAANATGVRLAALLQTESIKSVVIVQSATGGQVTTIQVVGLLSCRVGDTLVMQAYQNSGGALNAEAIGIGSVAETHLTIARVA
ncbi:MAG TPA: hypothetical protein VFY71_07415 [Planctomycetota bacterium]|nr:hypothetical protein [Planctomycetota bacterium]